MKKALILLLLLFLVGCDQQTTTQNRNTTEQDTTLETETNTASIPTFNPELSRDGYMIVSSIVTGADEYQFTCKDVSVEMGGVIQDVVPSTIVTSSTNSFSITSLQVNRAYEIQVRVIVDSEVQYVSQPKTFEYFEDYQTYDQDYNVNDAFDLYLIGVSELEVYYYRDIDHSALLQNNVNESGLEFVPKEFLDDFYSEGDIEIIAYTNLGLITYTINFQNITKPYIISNNDVIFTGEDLMFIFDYCGGNFHQITGSDISSSDYTLVDNIITINASFIQALFDAEPERNKVILSYTLETDTDVVIGYVFISRSEQ